MVRQGFTTWHVCTDMQHVFLAHVTTSHRGASMLSAWGCLHRVFPGSVFLLCRFTPGTSYCSWIGVVSLLLCKKAAMVYATCSESIRQPYFVCPSAGMLFDSWFQLHQPLLIGTIGSRPLLPCCQPQWDIASVSARLLLAKTFQLCACLDCRGRLCHLFAAYTQGISS